MRSTVSEGAGLAAAALGRGWVGSEPGDSLSLDRLILGLIFDPANGSD